MKDLILQAQKIFVVFTLVLCASALQAQNIKTDETLTGKGSNSEPLSIANGGVTAGKLATTNAPQAGQVLGFDGTNMLWKNAAAPVVMPRIYDSQNKEIGIYDFSSGKTLRYVEGYNTWVSLDLSGNASPYRDLPAGLSDRTFWYRASDCTGQRYLGGSYAYVPEGSMVRGVFISDLGLLFTMATRQSDVVVSSFIGENGCTQTYPSAIVAMPVGIFENSALGVGPYRLSR
jgi:hypothetical protein